MKLEAGKTYRLRNGETETLALHTQKGLLIGPVNKFFYESDTPNGHLVTGVQSLPHECDIMEEVK